MTKGIILAGGTGTRLYPLTKAVNKHLLPIYDKPMIYYSISVLMLAGIKDICIITRPEDKEAFFKLLGDGSRFGISMTYLEQPKANGIAEAFVIAKNFIGNDNVSLILGDNIFYGQGFIELLRKAKKVKKGAVNFCYQVKNPSAFGVAEFGVKDGHEVIIGIEEKPTNPKSDYAVTGIYFYDNTVIQKAESLSPSSRGELEITDINNLYIKDSELYVQKLGRGFSWLDTGTFESLNNAADFIRVMEERQGFKIACLEEIAYRQGFISTEKLLELSAEKENKHISDYLKSLV